MYAFFRLKISIGILTTDLKRNRLNPRHISFQKVQYLHTESFALRKSAVHAVQHARPVTGLRSASSCMKCYNCIILIIFARQKRLDAQALITLFKCIQLFFYLRKHRFVFFLIRHLNQQSNIFIALFQMFHCLYLIF